MQIQAKAKYIRQSPRKVRLVANKVKNLEVDKALQILTVWKKKAAQPLKKVILSALANAKENYQLDGKNLRIREIQVGPGPVLKRLKPRARGRGDIVRRRTSHIQVVLEEKEPPKNT